MEKKNKIILLIILIVTVLIVGICVFAIMRHESDSKNNEVTDAVKFKEEYEKLNGSKYENLTYPTVTINENNTIKYITEAQAVEMLKNGTGVIYFGFAGCPWCRTLITPLLDIARESHTTIYYLDILNIRSKIDLTSDKLIKTTKKGTDSYYDLLNLMSEYLKDYVLTDEDNKEYKTGEKRLYAPTLVAVKNGKIESFHEGTVDSQKSGFDVLTKKQEKELNKILTELVKTVSSNSCSSTGC